jgi:hypothetical protein
MHPGWKKFIKQERRTPRRTVNVDCVFSDCPWQNKKWKADTRAAELEVHLRTHQPKEVEEDDSGVLECLKRKRVRCEELVAELEEEKKKRTRDKNKAVLDKKAAESDKKKAEGAKSKAEEAKKKANNEATAAKKALEEAQKLTNSKALLASTSKLEKLSCSTQPGDLELREETQSRCIPEKNFTLAWYSKRWKHTCSGNMN